MKVKGFGAWPLRNESSGGQQSSFDEYNRHLKGKAYQHYEEYASRNVEEYHHYQEQLDLTAEQDDEQRAKKKKQEQDAKKRRQRMIQQVVVLAIGSVMITGAYQAHVNDDLAKKQAAEPTEAAVAVDPSDNEDNTSPTDAQPTQSTENPIQSTENPTQTDATASAQGGGSSSAQSSQSGDSSSSAQSSQSGDSSSSSQSSQGGSSSSDTGTSVSWQWNSDGSATLVVTDSSGNVVSQTAATVTTSEEPATCRTAGKTTYTASASANGQTYTDTRSENLPALGHVFDDGTVTTLGDGSRATDFECTRCHEHFVIKNSTTEE